MILLLVASTSVAPTAPDPRASTFARAPVEKSGSELELHIFATFTRNTMAMAAAPHDTFLLYPQPTPIQLRAFELLAVQPRL